MPIPKSRRAPPRRAQLDRVAPSRRSRKMTDELVTPAEQQEDQVLSHEEKHQLILAHAARHAAHRQGWGIGYSVAILASCFVVISGWWFTLDTNINRSVGQTPDQTLEQVKGAVKGWQSEWQEVEPSRPQVGTLLERLKKVEEELKAEQK